MMVFETCVRFMREVASLQLGKVDLARRDVAPEGDEYDRGYGLEGDWLRWSLMENAGGRTGR